MLTTNDHLRQERNRFEGTRMTVANYELGKGYQLPLVFQHRVGAAKELRAIVNGCRSFPHA